MGRIAFNEIDARVPFLKRRQARACLSAVFERLGFVPGEVNYVFCSDAYLLDVNRRYLGHDTYTDIITFDYGLGAGVCDGVAFGGDFEGEGEGRDVPALFFEGEIWGSASLGRTCDGGRGGECETGAFISGVLPAGVNVKRGAGRAACAGKGGESGFGGEDARVPLAREGGEGSSGLSGGEEDFTEASFGYEAKNAGRPAKALSGDIYISVPRVRENARKFHVKPLEELNRVLVHGILHLAGYKDKTPGEERRMHAMEDEMLKYCFRPVD